MEEAVNDAAENGATARAVRASLLRADCKRRRRRRGATILYPLPLLRRADRLHVRRRDDR